MKNYIRNLIAKAFDAEELEEAFISHISDSIDYQEIASRMLDNYDIEELIFDHAEDTITEPF